MLLIQFIPQPETCDLGLQIMAPPEILEPLQRAVESKQIDGLHIWDYDPGVWFSAEGRNFRLGAVLEDEGFVRIRIFRTLHNREGDELDGTLNGDANYEAKAPDWMWPEFIGPLRAILPFIQGAAA